MAILTLFGGVAEAASSSSSDAAALAIIPIIIGFMSLYMIIPMFVFGIVACLVIFWILMIVDVVKRDFKKDNDRLIWILVVVLAGWIGALIYYFMIKREDKH